MPTESRSCQHVAEEIKIAYKYITIHISLEGKKQLNDSPSPLQPAVECAGSATARPLLACLFRPRVRGSARRVGDRRRPGRGKTCQRVLEGFFFK